MKIRIIFLIIGLVFTACDMKREAVGSADEIIVIVDQDHREIIANVLNSIFNDTLFTPKPEPVYKLSYVDPAGFNDLKRQTNLILGSIGSNATNSGTRLIRSLLGNQQFEEMLLNHFKMKENKFFRDTQNIGQTVYVRKTGSDFAAEMRRSVQVALKDWRKSD